MRDRKTKVSVIGVNFNGMPHLETCLRSLINQSPPDFQEIMVDNCSSDGSLAYVRQRFPQLLFAANEKKLGYAAGINSGIAHARGEYVAPLDVDTAVERKWLTPVLEHRL